MSRRNAKQSDTTPDTKPETKKKSAWKKNDNDTQTHTAENGNYYVALSLDDGSYSVTVCGSKDGNVLYSTRVADSDALEAFAS